jgi:hypothetical protein
MAKMYVNENDAAEEFGLSADKLQQLVQEGKLRSFQDGAQKVYKREDLEAIAGEAGGGDEGGGDEIELAPALDDSGDEISLAAADESSAPAGKDDTVITAEGISIFDDEDLEIEAADPMAKTQIAPSLEDQFSVEGVGSGSGLLDLTRESDDTSLGAEVLDNIDMDSDIGSEIPEPEPYQPAAAPAAEPAQPVVVETSDPMSGLFSGMVVACTLVSFLLAGAGLAAFRDTLPSYLEAAKNQITITTAVVFGVILIAAIVGLFLGKSIATKKAALQRSGA